MYIKLYLLYSVLTFTVIYGLPANTLLISLTQLATEKCPSYVNFTKELKFLNECTSLRSPQVTYSSLLVENNLLCSMYYKVFEYICINTDPNIFKTVNTNLIKEFREAPNSSVEICNTLKLIDESLLSPTLSQILNNPSKCMHICTDWKDKVLSICSVTSFVWNLTMYDKLFKSDLKQTKHADETPLKNKNPEDITPISILNSHINIESIVSTKDAENGQLVPNPIKHLDNAIKLSTEMEDTSKNIKHNSILNVKSADINMSQTQDFPKNVQDVQQIQTSRGNQNVNTAPTNKENVKLDKPKEISTQDDGIMSVEEKIKNVAPHNDVTSKGLVDGGDKNELDKNIPDIESEFKNEKQQTEEQTNVKVDDKVKNIKQTEKTTIKENLSDKIEVVNAKPEIHKDDTKKTDAQLDDGDEKQVQDKPDVPNDGNVDVDNAAEEDVGFENDNELPPPQSEIPKVKGNEDWTNLKDEDSAEILQPKFSEVKTKVEATKPKTIDEDSLETAANHSNQDIDDSNSYFFSYFMMVCIMFICGYVAYHNKQKILALVLEGRKGRRSSRSSRRPNSANYRKLDSTLEEAVTSSCKKNTTQVIY